MRKFGVAKCFFKLGSHNSSSHLIYFYFCWIF
jgi:hypothetical protein